jgi:hypothetical protein
MVFWICAIFSRASWLLHKNSVTEIIPGVFSLDIFLFYTSFLLDLFTSFFFSLICIFFSLVHIFPFISFCSASHTFSRPLPLWLFHYISFLFLHFLLLYILFTLNSLHFSSPLSLHRTVLLFSLCLYFLFPFHFFCVFVLFVFLELCLNFNSL